MSNARKIHSVEMFFDETEDHGLAVRRGVALLIFHTNLSIAAALLERQIASNLIPISFSYSIFHKFCELSDI